MVISSENNKVRIIPRSIVASFCLGAIKAHAKTGTTAIALHQNGIATKIIAIVGMCSPSLSVNMASLFPSAKTISSTKIARMLVGM